MDGNYGFSDVVCHLQCEISSVEVTGLGCTGDARGLFLRCHVPAGGGRTIQIDSRCAEAERGHGGDSGGRSTTVVLSWRDVASLTCDGSPACVRELADRRSVVVFEVRRRRRRAILGRAVGSELVARAEVAWSDVVVAGGDSAVVRRLALVAAPARGGGRTVRDDGAPVMSVRMSVRVSETATSARRSVGSAPRRWNSGCEWSVGDEDVFGVVACVADDAFE